MTSVHKPVVEVERGRGSGKSSRRLQVCRNRVHRDFPVKLRAEDDYILPHLWQALLVTVSAVPEPCFAHKVEPGLLEHRSGGHLAVGPKEDRGAEDPLEGGNKPSVLRSALAEPEGVEHLSGGWEPDRGGLLPGRQSREEDRHESVLAPRQAVMGMPGDLQQESAISALVD